MAVNYYVYEHWRPDIGACFYVGKGRGDRAWRMRDRGDHHTKVVAKLARAGLAVDVRIVMEDFDEIEAFLAERLCIARRREEGHPLTNKTDGGDGVSGLVMSPESRAKMSAQKKGRPGQKTMLGKKHRPETIIKMRAAKAGKKPNNFGKPRSAATKEKQSKSWRAFYVANPEAWERAKENRRATLQSEKHRRSISKVVICLDDGAVYFNAKAAGEHYGIDVSDIYKVCARQRISAGKLRFAYRDEAVR